jgi:hypothetical protein
MFSGNFDDLKKMIDNSAENLFSRMNGIPTIQTKSKDASLNVTWKVKYFFITEQESANEYAEFMTNIIRLPNKYSLLREKENWTQNGELIKIVEYLEKGEEKQEEKKED